MRVVSFSYLVKDPYTTGVVYVYNYKIFERLSVAVRTTNPTPVVNTSSGLIFTGLTNYT